MIVSYRVKVSVLIVSLTTKMNGALASNCPAGTCFGSTSPRGALQGASRYHNNSDFSVDYVAMIIET